MPATPVNEILAIVAKGRSVKSAAADFYYYEYLDPSGNPSGVRRVDDSGNIGIDPPGTDGVYTQFKPSGGLAWYGINTGLNAPKLFALPLPPDIK